MASRYEDREVFYNDISLYAKKIKERGIQAFVHYSSPRLNEITQEQRNMLTTVTHYWTEGDKYYKLAHTHYGDPKLWWLIAWFNQAPTESHLSLGSKIEIPYPLEEIYGLFLSPEEG